MHLELEDVSKTDGDGWPLRDICFTFSTPLVYGLLSTNEKSIALLFDLVSGHGAPGSGDILVDGAASDGRSLRQFVRYPVRSARRRFDWFRRAQDPQTAVGALREAASDLRKGFILIRSDSVRGWAPHDLDLLQTTFQELSEDREISLVIGTDDRRIVYSLCDSAAVIADGYSCQSGTPADIYSTPVNSAVARLTGEINLIRARRLSPSDAQAHEFVTVDGGHRILTGKIDRSRLAPIDQTTTIAVRPEQISISFGASFPEDNLLRALVTDVKMLGNITAVELEADGLQLCAAVFTLVGLTAGDSCMVSIPRDSVIVFNE